MLSRPRRNRRSAAIRDMVRETRLKTDQLVQPLFLLPGKKDRQEIKSLPGNFRLSTDLLIEEIENCLRLDIRNFMIFPAVPARFKDREATYSYQPDNFYLEAARKIKEAFPECCLISDVAMDPYSSDGHDGLVRHGRILNDETLPILDKMAVAQAEAGFDLIGPSDMMDGRVGSIRTALDRAGFSQTGIMSYTAKYDSAFYGPFR
ncbi:MAG: porphobilinogen synthase, partial [Saprospiraceae bacterium]|nr:porphobilinogen synthase [Saprospiraceae bacterium]